MNAAELSERMKRLVQVAPTTTPDVLLILRRGRRRRMARRVGGGFMVAALLLAVALVRMFPGWSPVVEPAAPHPSALPLTHYQDNRLVFTHPVSWTPKKYDVTSTFSVSIVYLSNQPLKDPCTRSRISNGNVQISCGRPLEQLAPGGVLSEWSSHAYPLWTLNQVKGEQQVIAGRSAKITIDRPGDCASISADEAITAYIPQATPGHWYQFQACLRGPGTELAEKRVRALLASTRILQ
jgi:hypothetical protein